MRTIIVFFEKYKRYFSGYTTLYACCLIPNHFHFMFRVKKMDDINQEKLVHEATHAARSFLNNSSEIDLFLTDQLRRWYSGTSLYLNKKYNQDGQVFLEKTKRVSVKTEEKFLSLLCYIHHNPIHHGLSNAYDAWPYSSYNLYIQSSNAIASTELFRDLEKGNVKQGKEYFLYMHEVYKSEFDWEDYKLGKFPDR